MFGIDILAANWCLGMCGGIEFRVCRTGEQYRLRHNSSDGKRLAQWDSAKQDWGTEKRVTEEELMAILPEDLGWTPATFTAAWAGFAEGYQANVRVLSDNKTAAENGESMQVDTKGSRWEPEGAG
jgi:hypothetical protein